MIVEGIAGYIGISAAGNRASRAGPESYKPIRINLQQVNTNGFVQGTVMDVVGTHDPFVGIVTSNGGKYFIFGLATDLSNGTMVSTQPYAVMLTQH